MITKSTAVFAFGDLRECAEYTLRDLNGYHLRFGGPETTLDLGLWTLGLSSTG